MPVLGSSKSIKIIRKAESVIAVRKVKVCWSSPFKMPSLILSRYIKGTIGERAFSKKPTLWSLYISDAFTKPKTFIVLSATYDFSSILYNFTLPSLVPTAITLSESASNLHRNEDCQR